MLNGEVFTVSNADRHAEHGRQALVKPSIADAAFRRERSENSVTMVSDSFFASSRFLLGLLRFGGVGGTFSVFFSNTDMIFFIVEWFGALFH